MPLADVTRIHRVDVCIKGDHPWTVSDSSDDAAKTIGANFVEADVLHHLLDHLDDVLLF